MVMRRNYRVTPLRMVQIKEPEEQKRRKSLAYQENQIIVRDRATWEEVQRAHCVRWTEEKWTATVCNRVVRGAGVQ